MKKPPIYECQQNLFEIEPSELKTKHQYKNDSNYVFNIIDALSAPILTFSRQWADMLPKRLLEIVPLARMTALMKGEQLATYVECVIYIFTRTLEAPMDHEWVDIYTHVSCTALEEWFGEDHWKDTDAPRELNEWLRSKLNDLRRHIYNKRRDMLRQEFRDQDKTEKKMSKVEKKETSTQQQTLFT